MATVTGECKLHCIYSKELVFNYSSPPQQWRLCNPLTSRRLKPSLQICSQAQSRRHLVKRLPELEGDSFDTHCVSNIISVKAVPSTLPDCRVKMDWTHYGVR